MKLFKNENAYRNARLGFVLFVVLYSLLRQNITAIQPFLIHDAFNMALTLLAGVLVLWDLAVFKNLFKMKHIWWLIAFFALTMVSVLTNVRYGLVDSLKTAVNLFVQFFALYVVSAQSSRERLVHEVKVIGNTLCAVWFVAAAVSIYMYFADIFYHQTRYLWRDAVEIVQGFVRTHEGATVMRLWGVFVDPNFASGICVAVICLSLYMIFASKTTLNTVLHAVNILFQFLYIVLSNSRMGCLILCLTGAVSAWYFSWIFIRKRKLHRLIKEVLAVFIAVVAVGTCYAGVLATKTVLPYIKAPLTQVSNHSDAKPPFTEKEENPNANPSKTEGVESLDRQDIVSKEDVSNGRFDLWMNGVDLFLAHPILGVGPRNHYTAAAEVIPETPIAKGVSVHNSYLELLMGNGLTGFLVLLVFFVLCAKDTVLSRYKCTSLRSDGWLMLAVLSLLASGMFIACLFYTLSGATILMFVVLGYAVKLMACKNED